MRLGIASSEPETEADDGAGFFAAVHELRFREVRLVAYRDNPALLDAIDRCLAHRGSLPFVSLVLIDSPGAPLAGFPAWAATVAARFRSIYRFIVWNEPNAHAFWPYPRKGELEVRAASYARLLNETTAAIKRVRPGALVSAFGLAASHEPVRFLRAALAAGARVDSLSVHLYPGSPADGIAGSLALLRRLEAASPRATLYLDEFGWSVGPRRTEARQAALYGQLARALRADHPRVRSALVYRLRDGEGWSAGPVRPDGSRRPSWGVLRALATG